MFCPLQSKNINKEEELRFGQEMYETLNEAQRSAVDKILGAYHRRSATTAPCFFIDGPGGTGKTYLYNTLCYLFKGQGVSGLTVASQVSKKIGRTGDMTSPKSLLYPSSLV
ncbi:unnamed protein product [Rotaria magnacalcarata]